MITILKSPETPILSTITPDPGAPKVSPVVTPSSAGMIVYDCLRNLSINYPALRILRSVVMPDHIHFELFVTQPTDLPLGSMIAAFKSSCSVNFREKFPQSRLALENIPMFEKGFNDKIAFKAGAKDAFYNYIADNPRRYLVKKLHPDYFFHKMLIEVNGRKCGLYGNIFLLDNPVKSFVKISRDKSRMPDLNAKIKDWEETIRCGGVLVSPFINPEEKHFRDIAINNGNGIILIVDYRFSDRRKPYKDLFNLCAEGRLLIISTEEFDEAPRTMRYAHARELNAIAEQVAAISPCCARFSPRRNK